MDLSVTLTPIDISSTQCPADTVMKHNGTDENEDGGRRRSKRRKEITISSDSENESGSDSESDNICLSVLKSAKYVNKPSKVEANRKASKAKLTSKNLHKQKGSRRRRRPPNTENSPPSSGSALEEESILAELENNNNIMSRMKLKESSNTKTTDIVNELQRQLNEQCLQFCLLIQNMDTCDVDNLVDGAQKIVGQFKQLGTILAKGKKVKSVLKDVSNGKKKMKNSKPEYAPKTAKSSKLERAVSRIKKEKSTVFPVSCSDNNDSGAGTDVPVRTAEEIRKSVLTFQKDVRRSKRKGRKRFDNGYLSDSSVEIIG